MKSGSMTLYYKSDYGYILAPETTIKGSIIRTTMNPVMVEKATITSEVLGQRILESLNKSREAESICRSETKNFKFWQITGIKGFSAFSKKFECINIAQENDKLCISKLIRESDGSYSYPNKEAIVVLQLTIPKQELGNCIFEMFSVKQNAIYGGNTSFISVNEKRINYDIPTDDFENIGDGHTDAYQVYVNDRNDKNYIAFLIDNSYLNFTESAIKQRWQQMYGTLLEFDFQIVKNESEKIHVKGKTKNEEITSHIFQDGEGMLEVLYEIDLVNTSEKEKKMIKKEFEKIIASIKIQ